MKYFPISTALRKTIRGYSLSKFRQDALAAFVVSLVALPLSMALAIAVGLPPQHGLYTAIVAGIIVPLLGGSIWQVSGPTAAFVVVLAPIVSEHGLRGMIWSGIIAGFMLILMGGARLGRLINYIPYPVTTGFTSGIAVVLITISLNDFFGLDIAILKGEFIDKLGLIINNFGNFHPFTFGIGLTTLLLLWLSNRFISCLPGAIIAVFAGTILAMIGQHLGFEIETIGSKFDYISATGILKDGIPPYPPSLHLPTTIAGQLFTIPSIVELRSFLFPALAIAILAAIESLLSATVADSMAGTKHDPNAELTGIGIGNIFAAFATGIPAAGAISRTITCLNNGAKTPLASSIHAILIMLYVMLLAPYINYIPMAILSALLINTAVRMSHYKQFIRTFQVAHRSDIIVLLTCFFLTVFVDMVAGVGVGIICAAFLLIHRVQGMMKTEVSGNIDIKSSPKKLPQGVMYYSISGPLFFGSIEKAFDRYHFTHDYVNSLLLDLRNVPFIDMTGLVALRTMLEAIAHEERRVYIIINNDAMLARIQKKLSKYNVHHYVQFYDTYKQALTASKAKHIN